VTIDRAVAEPLAGMAVPVGIRVDAPTGALAVVGSPSLPVVQVESLTKRFGEVLAVDDLSFVLEPGTITGFLGPNGAGKTTTLRMLLGLAAPSAGRAMIFGKPYAQVAHAALRIGAVLEATDFHPGRSGRDHLRTLGRAVGVPDRRVDEVLRLVELEDAARRRVKGYSLGMRQRLGLAGALLGDPELLVLDEPANGLDPEGILWIRTFMRYLADQGRSVFVSSHLLSELGQVVDQLIVIGRGRLLAAGSLHDVLGTGGRDVVTVVSPDATRLRELITAAGAEVVVEVAADGVAAEGVATGAPERLEVTGLDAVAVGELAAAHGIVLHELTPHEPSLEDAFLRLTAETQEFRAGEVGP